MTSTLQILQLNSHIRTTYVLTQLPLLNGREVRIVATNSFLKEVIISEKALARTFVDALDKVHKDRYQDKVISRPVRELKGTQVKEFFNKK